ncbi:MAG: carbonic anhydrase [Orrella sp.]
MCFICNKLSLGSADAQHATGTTSRRAMLGALGAIPLAGAFSLGRSAHAATPPKPQNVLSPDEALDRLMAGNERYVSGKSSKVDFASTRAALTGGQNPYACLVSCADSRIGPEYCFDEGRGDLFVTRVAGNFVNTDILASLEYGTAVLGSPLIMVLGHTSCGAIGAAVSAYVDNASFPGHIQSLTTALAPSVRQASKTAQGEALIDAATRDNIRLNVRKLQESNPIISERVANGDLKIVGGLYHLDTGRVEMIS